jgi:hypothetical protein
LKSSYFDTTFSFPVNTLRSTAAEAVGFNSHPLGQGDEQVCQGRVVLLVMTLNSGHSSLHQMESVRSFISLETLRFRAMDAAGLSGGVSRFLLGVDRI